MSVNNTGFIIKDGVRVIDSSVGALTVQGDVNLGANKLKTTNLLIKEFDANTIAIRNAIDNAYKYLNIQGIGVEGDYIYINSSGQGIFGPTADNSYFKILAKDNTVGGVEVARAQGAADPYFKATLGCVMGGFATGAEPTTPVAGIMIYDSTANIMKYWNGTLWKPTSTI